MSKFKKKTQVKQEIPTSSMPDVVFMLLFFFMVTTEMRETTIEVKQQIPRATQLKKLMKKGLVANLYIGEPNKTAQYGKEPKIQADDVFIDTKDIVRWVNEKKSGNINWLWKQGNCCFFRGIGKRPFWRGKDGRA